MNSERLLDRIFALARRAPAAEIPELPFGFETSIMAHWREAQQHRRASSGLLRGLRWGALIACSVALLAGALGSDELAAFNHRNDAESRVADNAIVAGYGYE